MDLFFRNGIIYPRVHFRQWDFHSTLGKMKTTPPFSNGILRFVRQKKIERCVPLSSHDNIRVKRSPKIHK